MWIVYLDKGITKQDYDKLKNNMKFKIGDKVKIINSSRAYDSDELLEINKLEIVLIDSHIRTRKRINYYERPHKIKKGYNFYALVRCGDLCDHQCEFDDLCHEKDYYKYEQGLKHDSQSKANNNQ